jgi:hypothetical protein
MQFRRLRVLSVPADGKDAMLQNLSPEVRYCLRHAEDCAERARREPDASLQRDFFDMETRWLKLARSYQFLDQLNDFTSYNAQQRRTLSERLQRLRGRHEIDANGPTKG